MSKAELIEAIMTADGATLAAIEKAAQGTQQVKPRPGTIRQACEVLGCCRVTAQRYAKQGLLHPIHITARRVRYDLNEVERLAMHGAV